MFNKLTFVAILFFACYFATSYARPSLTGGGLLGGSGLPTDGIADTATGALASLPVIGGFAAGVPMAVKSVPDKVLKTLPV